MAYGYFINAAGTPMILVDKHGNRYADESSTAAGHNWWVLLDDFDIKVPEYTRIPTFMIFDGARLKAGPSVAMEASLYQPTWRSHMELRQQCRDFKGMDTTGRYTRRSCCSYKQHHIRRLEYRRFGTSSGRHQRKHRRDRVDNNHYQLQQLLCCRKQLPTLGEIPRHCYRFKLHHFMHSRFRPGGPNSQEKPSETKTRKSSTPQATPSLACTSCGELGSMWALYPTGGGNNSELYRIRPNCRQECGSGDLTVLNGKDCSGRREITAKCQPKDFHSFSGVHSLFA